MNQMTRTRKLEAIGLLVKQEQALKQGDRVAKQLCELRHGCRKLFERNIERDFAIGRIGKSFDLQNLGWQRAGASYLLQLEECFGERGRKDVAVIHRHDGIAFRQVITKGAWISMARRPLRAVAIVHRFGGVIFDFAFPVHSAHARKGFAQNVELQLYLCVVASMLVMTSTANAEMWAKWFCAPSTELADFQRLRPD